MRRLERLVAMALYLGARRRVLARDVAARFDISLRTVYRDVAALIAAGFPVEGTAGDGYRIAQHAFQRPLALTAEEAEVLAIAARGFRATAEPALRDALASATAKLEVSLDRSARARVRELDARIVDGGARRSSPSAAILATLRERRVAHIRYVDTRTGKRSERDVEPLGLVCRGDAWWLLAYCLTRRDARAFRVDAIAAWTDTGATFSPRDGFSLAEIVERDRHLAAQLFGS
jgi:predicted DNA-binding transcriptional regulator YafY